MKEHTRVRGTDEPSLLILILTNKEIMIEQVVYEPIQGENDHLVLMFDYICSAERSSDVRQHVQRTNFFGLATAIWQLTISDMEYKSVNQHWS